MKAFKITLFVVVVVGSLIWACAESSSGKSEKNMETEIVNFNGQEVIQLEQPNLERDFSLMQALSQRESVREYGGELTLRELSDLLWAANGINRSESGKRTAPSAINAQDIDVYVCTKAGAFLYDARSHVLNRVSTENLIPAIAAGQDFVNEAPISLVLVSDLSRYGMESDRLINLGAMDAGYVSQNICLFCTAANLANVPRATMDIEALQKGLNLTEKQIPMLNHPVGKMK